MLLDYFMSRRKIIFFSLIALTAAAVLWFFLPKGGNGPPRRGSFRQKSKAIMAENNPSVRERPSKLRVPILLYHYIEDVTDLNDTLRRSMATRPYFFEIQMRYLATHGYSTISLSDLKSALEGDTNLPAKPIILTFDDGFRDYYYNAFPILKKYNLHATLYLIANHLGRSGNLTAEMVREMIDSGVFELGSHTLNHVWLSRVGLNEAKREVFESKKVLSDIFNYDVKHFAYPGGFADERVSNLVKEAGYETAASTKHGVWQALPDLYSLKRLHVGNLGEGDFSQLIEKEYKE